MTKLVCPECGSDQVYCTHKQWFMENTGDHYLHAMKTHDDDSESGCLSCEWRGIRRDLKEQGHD